MKVFHCQQVRDDAALAAITRREGDDGRLVTAIEVQVVEDDRQSAASLSPNDARGFATELLRLADVVDGGEA